MLDLTATLIKDVEYLNNNTSDVQIVDADTLLVDAILENDFEITGFAQEIFDIYKASIDKVAVKKMFYTFAEIEFDDFLNKLPRCKQRGISPSSA